MAYLLAKSDCRRGIPLADQSVHTIVTSPPYWGLRDYGELNQIGLESTPEAYVARMVGVFRELRRVLRDDGTAWLNLGDSYSGVGRQPQKRKKDASGVVRPKSEHECERCGKPFQGGLERRFCSSFCGGSDNSRRKDRPGNLKAKDLIGIPWRVAFALQADGWYLRSDIIWAKPNPMPESVTDRPSKSHEYLFLFSKRERYYYDGEAIKEPHIMRPQARPNGHKRRRPGIAMIEHVWDGTKRDDPGVDGDPSGRNKRSVWTVPIQPFPGAHFATFPPDLIEPCIKAGSSEKGCCGACGAPWVRIVKKKGDIPQTNRRRNLGDAAAAKVPNLRPTRRSTLGAGSGGDVPLLSWETIGWKPSCKCPEADPVPCVILDPFNGAGTTPLVSLALGRHGIGFDLSPRYLRMARRRIERPHARPERPERDESLPLFGMID